ncbi:MAG: GntR family transcriptional regulator [Anaerolineales bacterium]|nr:GntR family transcriptional regulator [Anaerolineales bacterium]
MSDHSLNTIINHDTYIPLYIQVIDSLTNFIECNKFKPGYQLPAEAKLCRSFDVSRTVIRQALKELEYKGLLYRKKGRGTCIAEPKIRESLVQNLTGFYQDMEAKRYRPHSKVLKQKKVSAAKKVAENLELAEGTPAIQIDRLRFLGQEPIVLVNSYLPFDLVPELDEVDLSDQSLYVYLQNEHGIQISHSKRYIEAVPANQLEAELLRVDIGSPLILLDSISYLSDGTPIEYFHALHRGDRSRFEVELISVDQASDTGPKLIEVSNDLSQ